MENVEQEYSNADIKEKIPVSGKKHGILHWKLQKDSTKKDEETVTEDVPLKKFELEAKKMCKKYNEYTQRKEQEMSRVSSFKNTYQVNLVQPAKVRRFNVRPHDPKYDTPDQVWNDIGLDSDTEQGIPRPEVTSVNNKNNPLKSNHIPRSVSLLKNKYNIPRPAIISANCNKYISRSALASKNYNEHISRPSVVPVNKENNSQSAVMTIKCDNISREPLILIDCEDEQIIPQPAVTLTDLENDQPDTPRPAVATMNCGNLNDPNLPHPAINSIEYDNDHNIPRPAGASMNLTKIMHKLDKQRRRRRAKELKSRLSRLARVKQNKRYEEYFLDESETDGDDEMDDEKEFSLKKEFAFPSTKHFNRWQKQNVKETSSETSEQQDSDLAKWVFNVLSISKVTSNSPNGSELTSSPTFPTGTEDNEIPAISPAIEMALEEYSRVGPDSESKPFTGSPAQISDPNVCEILPNMVPRHCSQDEPIKHSHHISNEPISDDEEEQEVDGVVSMTTRLIGRAIKSSSKKTDVKPFRCNVGRKRELKEEFRDEDFRDEAPDRWTDNLINEYDTILAAMRI